MIPMIDSLHTNHGFGYGRKPPVSIITMPLSKRPFISKLSRMAFSLHHNLGMSRGGMESKAIAVNDHHPVCPQVYPFLIRVSLDDGMRGAEIAIAIHFMKPR